MAPLILHSHGSGRKSPAPSALLTPSTPARSVTLARDTALAEPKACSKAFLRNGSYARDLVQRVDADGLGAPGPVRADGKAVRLVAQALDVVEDRIARLQHEGGLARHVEMLAARIPVRPLGDAHHRQVGQAQLVQHRLRRRKLALPAVDQHQVGPGLNVLRLLVAPPARPAPSAAG